MSAIVLAVIRTVDFNWDVSIFKYEFRLLDYRLWSMFSPWRFNKGLVLLLFIALLHATILLFPINEYSIILGIMYIYVWIETYNMFKNDLLLTKLTLK